MKFDLEATLRFSKDAELLEKELHGIIEEFNRDLKEKFGDAKISDWSLSRDQLDIAIVSETRRRSHDILLQFRNILSKKLGKKYKIGVRGIDVRKYEISFDLEREPLRDVTIPFADVKIEGRKVRMRLKETGEDFLSRNYIDRMVKLVREKVENQYYEGKKEFWKLIWKSEEKVPVWDKDPTEEMLRRGWIVQGPTKGKWFYRPQAAAILRAMERIAIEEVLKPLGFQEVIESHIVPFDVWLKTGHLEGMPGEIYYVCEPRTRDILEWERFVDLVKITREVPEDELRKNISLPSAGICYAQCPVIYWSLKGKTIAEESLPLLIYDRTAISGRYESGGRHGIERVDEFHRIEPVYIGKPEQLIELRDKLIERYKHVFNNILDLEWRMAWVTPWYLQQAGKVEEEGYGEGVIGTMDFEAYLPYRGERESSKWLEFQNLSILGDKYIKSFNIKTQKGELWSGCSGIGLERWTAAFLAQKGLEPENWPDGFRRYLDRLPEGIKIL
ncbi:MAG TPA: serine--tRNA ligase [Thermoplasmatales archaeon]|nr:serine--tRNA ligase [Thermoplasmatales archaeon]